MKKQSTISGSPRHYQQYNQTERIFSRTPRVWKWVFLYYLRTGLENELKASRVFKNTKNKKDNTHGE